jgi:hypothetical protein
VFSLAFSFAATSFGNTLRTFDSMAFCQQSKIQTRQADSTLHKQMLRKPFMFRTNLNSVFCRPKSCAAVFFLWARASAAFWERESRTPSSSSGSKDESRPMDELRLTCDTSLSPGYFTNQTKRARAPFSTKG